jgi:septal ring factor EnvC (AmiA/AmiB activator)
MHNNQLANSAVEKLNNILKRHEADRNSMVGMMKKIYSSYNSLKDSFSKLTITHNQVTKDLERAQAEIRRLEKAQEKVPALAFASASMANAEPAADPVFEMPELVSAEEAAAAECDDLLTGEDINQIEHYLSESVSFELSNNN